MQISTLTTQFGPGPLSQLTATQALQNADNKIFYLQLGITAGVIVLGVMAANKTLQFKLIEKEDDENYLTSRYQ